MATLFGKKHIVMLPEDVVGRIETDSTAFTNWEPDTNGRLFIKRLRTAEGPEGTSTRQAGRLVFLLGDEVPLPFFLRWTTYAGKEYEQNPVKYKVVTVGRYDYIVTLMPMNKIKRRIKAIRVEP